MYSYFYIHLDSSTFYKFYNSIQRIRLIILILTYVIPNFYINCITNYKFSQALSLILIMQSMKVITRPKPTITAVILAKMALTIRIMNQNLRVTDTVKATRTETVSMVLTKATAPTRKALVMNTETMEAITTNPLPNGWLNLSIQLSDLLIRIKIGYKNIQFENLKQY